MLKHCSIKLHFLGGKIIYLQTQNIFLWLLVDSISMFFLQESHEKKSNITKMWVYKHV